MNGILRRRRALMGKGETDPTIYGSKLTWEIGILSSSTGELLFEYPTYISSNYVKVDSEKILTYNGPEKDENDTDYIVYICYYGENHEFVSREQLYSVSNHIITRQVPANIKYVRFSYGHATASGVNMNVSDGSLLVCTVQDRSEVKNGFVDGSYVHGSTSFSVSDNVFSMLSVIGSGSSNTFNPNFKYPLNIKVGDTVRVVCTRTQGSLSGAYILATYVGGNSIGTVTWRADATAFDVSATSSTNGNSVYLTFQRNTGQDRTFTNYKCRIKVYVNGVQVLPEV